MSGVLHGTSWGCQRVARPLGLPLSVVFVVVAVLLPTVGATNILHIDTDRITAATHPGGDDGVEAVLQRMRWWSPGRSPVPPTDQYLLFSMDVGGMNNIRIGWEMTGVVAKLTGRTLVLPPANRIFLLDWGPRASSVPARMQNDTNTTTAIEDLLDLEQLKATLPTLTWAEFHARTGYSWESALADAGRLEGKDFEKCEQLDAYRKVPQPILFMSGEMGRREGFNCGEWEMRGGPKAQFAKSMGPSGFALLTHGFTWHQDVFRIAAEAVNYLGLFKYTALHARYNDFRVQMTSAVQEPDDIFRRARAWLQPGAMLYVASDEPEKFRNLGENFKVRVVTWPDLLGPATGSLLAKTKARYSPERWFKLIGPVEQLICTFAKVFVGTDRSTFSGHIQAMRIKAEAPVTTRLVHTNTTMKHEDIENEVQAWLDNGGAETNRFRPLPPNEGRVFLQLGSEAHTARKGFLHQRLRIV